MISEMNDIVWAINPGNDSMEKIVQRMESFARPLLQVKGISFVFSYEPAVLQLNLPMEKRKNFYLIFKEGVNNVLKYSNCKKLWVKVSQSYNHVTLEVKDDGDGFDAEQMKLLAGKSLSGNGLINMKRRAFEMKGTCTIESEKGNGTTLHLRFPIT
jgi:signal transduction histidine kinase